MENPEIYLDYASTTPVHPEVVKTMKPYFSEIFANPESAHTPGRKAKQAVDKARQTAAKIFNCSINEIIFTSGGTESNNLAILGFIFANQNKGKHLISSEIEHSSIVKIFEYLKKQHNFEVTYLKPNKKGLLDPEDLKKAIRDDTILASIIFANNEIGTIQEIKEFGKICTKADVAFHTDACQAAGAIDIDVEKMNIDLMTINSSKIYGPKGAGLLLKKSHIKLEPILRGGPQEFNLRSGTHNTPAIIGFIKALEIAQKNKKQENERLTKIRDYAIEELTKKIPNCVLNGSQTKRLPNNINIQIKNIDGLELIFHLDKAGIFCSTGSACNTSIKGPSQTLRAIGLSNDQANSTLRFTLGYSTTVEKIDYVVKTISDLLSKMGSF